MIRGDNLNRRKLGVCLTATAVAVGAVLALGIFNQTPNRTTPQKNSNSLRYETPPSEWHSPPKVSIGQGFGVKAHDYIIYQGSEGDYYAMSGENGEIMFQASDASTVVQNAVDSLERGSVYLKGFSKPSGVTIPENVSIVAGKNGRMIFHGAGRNVRISGADYVVASFDGENILAIDATTGKVAYRGTSFADAVENALARKSKRGSVMIMPPQSPTPQGDNRYHPSETIDVPSGAEAILEGPAGLEPTCIRPTSDLEGKCVFDPASADRYVVFSNLKWDGRDMAAGSKGYIKLDHETFISNTEIRDINVRDSGSAKYSQFKDGIILGVRWTFDAQQNGFMWTGNRIQGWDLDCPSDNQNQDYLISGNHFREGDTTLTFYSTIGLTISGNHFEVEHDNVIRLMGSGPNNTHIVKGFEITNNTFRGVYGTENDIILTAGDADEGLIAQNEFYNLGTPRISCEDGTTPTVINNSGGYFKVDNVKLITGSTPAARVDDVTPNREKTPVVVASKPETFPAADASWEVYKEFDESANTWDLVFEWRTDPGENVSVKYLMDLRGKESWQEE